MSTEVDGYVVDNQVRIGGMLLSKTRQELPFPIYITQGEDTIVTLLSKTEARDLADWLIANS